MDIQVEELLDKIRREGVEAARAEAAKIAAEAEAARKSLIEAAEKEAAAIVAKAKADAVRAEEAGRAALAQASRDLLIAFKDRLQALLDAAVRAESAAALKGDALAQAVPVVLKAMAAGGQEELSLLLPEAELKALEAKFASSLAAELKKGLVIKPHADLAAGFRVVEKGGAAYYDFSAEAVAELLSRHLNARLAETLRSAAKGM